MRLLLLLLIVVVSACCRERVSTDAQSADEQAPPRLIRTLEDLNSCTSDGSCWDIGYVKGLGCHIPTGRRHEADARLAASLDAERRGWHRACGPRADLKECSISCGPFYGYECVSGRCAARRQRPSTNICFSEGLPVDCNNAIKEIGPSFWSAFECRKFCDGGHVNGLRAQIVFDTDNGAHFLAVDYFRCSDCLP